MQSREGKARIVSLLDLAEILRGYHARCSGFNTLFPDDAIAAIEKLHSRIAKYARQRGLRDVWLNIDLTEEYIRIIFSDELHKDSLAYFVLFGTDKRISRVNCFLRQLREYELNTYQNLHLLADCTDMQRMACAGEIIQRHHVVVSDAIFQRLVTHHDIAVSIAICFEILDKMSRSSDLLFEFIRNIDLVRSNLIEHEKAAYLYGVESSHGFVAALIRLRENNIQLDCDDLLFLMRNHQCAVGIATTFVIFSSHPQQVLFRKKFIENFQSVREHYIEQEYTVCSNSDIARQVIDPAIQGGVIIALWCAGAYPEMYADLFNWENIQSFMLNPDQSHSMIKAMRNVCISMREDGDVSGVMAAIRQHPDKAMLISRLFCCLLSQDRIGCIAELDFSQLSLRQFKRVVAIFEGFSGNSHEAELCSTDNLEKVIMNVSYTPALLVLFNEIAKLKFADSTSCLNQSSFDCIIELAPYADHYHLLGRLIDSNKFTDYDLFKLLDYPNHAERLCKAMFTLSVCMPVIGQDADYSLRHDTDAGQYSHPFIKKMLDAFFRYPDIAVELAQEACGQIKQHGQFPDIHRIDAMTDLVNAARNRLPPRITLNGAPVNHLLSVPSCADPRFLRRSPPLPREYFEKVRAATVRKNHKQIKKTKDKHVKARRMAVIN